MRGTFRDQAQLFSVRIAWITCSRRASAAQNTRSGALRAEPRNIPERPGQAPETV